jgi:hypothetical protein
VLRGGCDGHLTRRRCQSADVAVADGGLVGIFRINTPWVVIGRGVINRVVIKRVVINRVVIRCWCQRTAQPRGFCGFEIRSQRGKPPRGPPATRVLE